MISSHSSTKSQASAPKILSTPTLTSIKHSNSFVDHFYGTHQDPNSLKTTHNPRTSKNDSMSSAQASNDLIQSGIDWLQKNIEAIDVRDTASEIFNQLVNEADPSHAKKSTTQTNIDKQRINECICAALFAAKPPPGLIIESIKTGDLAVDFIVEIAIKNKTITIGFDPFEPPKKESLEQERIFQSWLSGAYSKHVDNKKVFTDDDVRCPVIGALDLRACSRS